jgi:hypothetical protein
VIVLTDPNSFDTISKNIPASQNVCPSVAKSASGGYDVQPEFGAPPRTKKLASMTRPPARYVQ